MSGELELLQKYRYEELWQNCCGFISLSLADFMKIQERLLLEQIELLKKCELGKIIMKGAQPATVEEFRVQVPLTTYADYAPYFLERREDILPEKPKLWHHTSGRSGEYPVKWIPLTERQYQEMGPAYLAGILFSSCSERASITLKPNDKILYALAPPPYFSGTIGWRIAEIGIFDFMPPLDEADKMAFADRVQAGFKLAMYNGMDVFGGISSILVAVGQRFSEGGQKVNIKPLLLRPGALRRMLRGYIRSKIARRPMLPRDIWNLKGLLAGGTDTQVFKEKIKEMWGRYPLDVYAGTEPLMIAMQTWDYQAMTFFPHFNYLEFIPEEESIKLDANKDYKPAVLTLDEVIPGKNYSLVITNFYGGGLVRYKVGDMIKITSLRNEKLNIDIPQMLFHSRIDDLIDIAGFTRLTEGIIWRAIENTGIPYSDWTARKEVFEKSPLLHIFIELKKGNDVTAETATGLIHEQMKKLDSDYANLESFTGMRPLKVTVLKPGAFQKFTERQQKKGADLAHLKIPHINPSDKMLEVLKE